MDMAGRPVLFLKQSKVGMENPDNLMSNRNMKNPVQDLVHKGNAFPQ